MRWMLRPYRRYFDFRGRSRRREYWMFVLFQLLVTVALGLFQGVFGAGGDLVSAGPGPLPRQEGFAFGAVMGGSVVATLFALANFVPNLSVSVRRLHDRNLRGWWLAVPLGLYGVAGGLVFGSLGAGIGGSGTAAAGLAIAAMLLGLVALASAIGFIVVLCLPGTAGTNRFGPDPKAGQTLGEVFG